MRSTAIVPFFFRVVSRRSIYLTFFHERTTTPTGESLARRLLFPNKSVLPISSYGLSVISLHGNLFLLFLRLTQLMKRFRTVSDDCYCVSSSSSSHSGSIRGNFLACPSAPLAQRANLGGRQQSAMLVRARTRELRIRICTL